jgi:hypothetical protein
VHRGPSWVDLRGVDHLEDQRIDAENNIKMDLEEVGWGGMDWIDMAQDRERWRAIVSAVMNLWVP